jgi:hypothetical protein
MSSSLCAQTNKNKTVGVDLAGHNFPALSKTLDTTENASGTTSPCLRVRALRLNELDAKWKPLVANISLKCKVGEGFDNKPDANTTAIAKLKPGAANYAGVSILEIRMMDSAWGNDYQYVLNAPFSRIKKQLKLAIRNHCIKEQGITVAITDNICAVVNDGQHGGLYLDTGEGGGIWLHPDPDNPNRSIYASAWSE